ncbi:hypothetical protein Syun_019331 [Stephania yunnanensis]|uniref:Uncharacterized protein n=1 Tax=Stephania yunnanensis TaxID=152371 RepID=A0AAP0IU26_9MAGN
MEQGAGWLKKTASQIGGAQRANLPKSLGSLLLPLFCTLASHLMSFSLPSLSRHWRRRKEKIDDDKKMRCQSRYNSTQSNANSEESSTTVQKPEGLNSILVDAASFSTNNSPDLPTIWICSNIHGCLLKYPKCP